jgi:hypothetical protein
MDYQEIISMVKKAANSLSDTINEQGKFTKEHISKLMPITIEFMSAMSMASAKLAAQETEISMLRDRIDKLEAQNPNSTKTNDIICETLAELAERDERSRNIIMFNVPELDDKTPKSDYPAQEKKQVSDLIDNVECKRSGGIIRVHRLGLRQKDKMRPIKVVFDNSVDPREIIYSKRALPPSIQVKPDYTVKQRNNQKALWTEIEARKSRGEENLGIKFVNGTPKIVVNHHKKNFKQL